MILYLDTSSLVKLYFEEAHSDETRQRCEKAEIIATSVVAFPEAVAAFARRRRDGDLDESTFEQVRGQLAADWPNYAVVEVDELAAGELAAEHPLRGFDAIHLAAALTLHHDASAGAEMSFSSFDRQQLAAAEAMGLSIR
jgi:predicted nucleic acid-binding protein